MSGAEYAETCLREVARLQDQLNYYGPDVHIFEGTGNEPLREITDKLRDDLRHGIRTFEQIIAPLERDAAK